MRTTGRQPHRRSKTPVIFIVAVIVLAAALTVGYFLWKQTQGVVKTGTISGENGTVSSSAQNTVEYEGSTYTYNDHLSNYLFMGIDSSEEVSNMESQMDAGQADSIFIVSLDRAEETIQVLSIPRDTITEIEVFNPSGTSLGMTDNHINLQYAYGDGKEESCELMKTAVSNLLRGLPIQGYYSMNISGISEVGISALSRYRKVTECTGAPRTSENLSESTDTEASGENADGFLVCGKAAGRHSAIHSNKYGK